MNAPPVIIVPLALIPEPQWEPRAYGREVLVQVGDVLDKHHVAANWLADMAYDSVKRGRPNRILVWNDSVEFGQCRGIVGTLTLKPVIAGHDASGAASNIRYYTSNDVDSDMAVHEHCAALLHGAVKDYENDFDGSAFNIACRLSAFDGWLVSLEFAPEATANFQMWRDDELRRKEPMTDAEFKAANRK